MEGLCLGKGVDYSEVAPGPSHGDVFSLTLLRIPTGEGWVNAQISGDPIPVLGSSLEDVTPGAGGVPLLVTNPRIVFQLSLDGGLKGSQLRTAAGRFWKRLGEVFLVHILSHGLAVPL